MKSKFVRFGVLIASVMGLLVTSTPAEATTFKTVTLQGNANLTNCKDVNGGPSNGLSYPVWTGGTTVPDTKTTTKTGAKGLPEVNTEVLNGNLCDFSFAADCVKVSVGKKTGVDNCLILATGTVTGFCGLSSGLGTATLINLGPVAGGPPNKETISTDFKFSSTGTNLRVSDKDGDSRDWLQGDVEAIPAGSGSCTSKTATTFIIAGEVVIKDCNPGPIPPPVC